MTVKHTVMERSLLSKTPGVGMSMRRSCSKCGQHKPLPGGKLNKKTRQWVCKDCCES